ncbi:uncharacterized protein LOC124898033 [Capsicum annuum]|uniref:uncharacterized protein LOC124898033 n=1 Tax=Capsicum annuum TaxID=4072 RepID=UPI001FB19ABD|nr:uncharacterized protein LOC124898033 [Capsicum annuum]
MTIENFVQPAISRFDGHYDHWSMLMENFIRSKEFWPVVSVDVQKPATGTALSEAQKTELDSLRLKDLKVKNYLFQAIDRSILETILCKDTSKQIWDSMKKKYQGMAKAKQVQLQALRGEFEALRMQGGESVTEYFSKVLAIVNKMRIHEEKLEDVTIIEKILHSMTAKFNYIVCSIEESKDVDVLSIDELKDSLLVHEQKLNQQNKDEVALKAVMSSKGRDPEKTSGKEKITTRKGRKTKLAIPRKRKKDATSLKLKDATSLKLKDATTRKEDAETKEEEEEVSLLMVYTSKEKVPSNLCIADARIPDAARKKLDDKEDEEPEQFLEISSQANLTVQDAGGVEHESGNAHFNNKRPQCNRVHRVGWKIMRYMGSKTIDAKWVYKTKLKKNGEVDKFKARLVAKGYKQEYGVDYEEVYTPVARLDTIGLVIALAAQMLGKSSSWT